MDGRRETVQQDGTGDNPIYCPAASVAGERTDADGRGRGTLLFLSLSLLYRQREEDHFVHRRRRSLLDFLLIEWNGNEENTPCM